MSETPHCGSYTGIEVGKAWEKILHTKVAGKWWRNDLDAFHQGWFEEATGDEVLEGIGEAFPQLWDSIHRL